MKHRQPDSHDFDDRSHRDVRQIVGESAEIGLPRILINLGGLRRGGGLTHVAAFLPELVAHRPAKFSLYISRDLEEWASAFGECHSHDYPAGDWRLRVADQLAVRRLGRKHDVTLSVMNHGPIALGRPHLLWACNVLHFDSGSSRAGMVNNEFARRAMQTASEVIFPSESARSEGERWSRDSSHVLPHPFRGGLGRWSEPSKGSELRIFVPSTGNDHKNLALLPKLADLLIELGYRPRIGVTATSVPAHDAIVSLPRYQHSELAEVASRHDVALLPTFRESFSYPLLELAELGMPVAASDIGPHRELDSHAVLFDPLDAPAAARALLRARISENRTGSNRYMTPTLYSEAVWARIDNLLESS